MCIFVRFCFIVVDDVCSGSVSMFMVKLLLWKIVCFCFRGGVGFVFRLCSGCCVSSVCCRNCDACSCKWSLIGSVVVSAWRCCMFVSCVHPVTVLKAVFCTICNLLVLVCEMIGDHIVFAYSSIGSVIVLYVTRSVSFDFPQCVVVSCLRMLTVCFALCVVFVMCCEYVSFVSNVSPNIFGVFVIGRGVLSMCRLIW